MLSDPFGEALEVTKRRAGERPITPWRFTVCRKGNKKHAFAYRTRVIIPHNLEDSAQSTLQEHRILTVYFFGLVRSCPVLITYKPKKTESSQDHNTSLKAHKTKRRQRNNIFWLIPLASKHSCDLSFRPGDKQDRKAQNSKSFLSSCWWTVLVGGWDTVLTSPVRHGINCRRAETVPEYEWAAALRSGN
jgi:hypothetical protein